MNGTPFDIRGLAAADTAEMNVKDLSGRETGWLWTFAGPGHPRTLEQRAADDHELVEAQIKLRRKAAGEQIPDEPVKSPADNRRDNARRVARRVIAWSPAVIRLDGEDLACTEENIVRVLLDPGFAHVFTQALLFVNAEASFMRRSAAPSSGGRSDTSATSDPSPTA